MKIGWIQRMFTVAMVIMAMVVGAGIQTTETAEAAEWSTSFDVIDFVNNEISFKIPLHTDQYVKEKLSKDTKWQIYARIIWLLPDGKFKFDHKVYKLKTQIEVEANYLIGYLNFQGEKKVRIRTWIGSKENKWLWVNPDDEKAREDENGNLAYELVFSNSGSNWTWGKVPVKDFKWPAP